MAPIIYPGVLQKLVQYMNQAGPQAILARPSSEFYDALECVVASKVPNPRPVRMIALLSVPYAGPQRLVLSTRRVIAQIYDVDEDLAEDLAETAAGVIEDTKYQGLGIKQVNIIGSPCKYPAPNDPDRWQLTADITLRAKASVL